MKRLASLAALTILAAANAFAESDEPSFEVSLATFEFEGLDSSFSDLYIVIESHLLDSMALRVAYNNVVFDLELAKTQFTGSRGWHYDGTLAYPKRSF